MPCFIQDTWLISIFIPSKPLPLYPSHLSPWLITEWSHSDWPRCCSLDTLHMPLIKTFCICCFLAHMVWSFILKGDYPDFILAWSSCTTVLKIATSVAPFPMYIFLPALFSDSLLLSNVLWISLICCSLLQNIRSVRVSLFVQCYFWNIQNSPWHMVSFQSIYFEEIKIVICNLFTQMKWTYGISLFDWMRRGKMYVHGRGMILRISLCIRVELTWNGVQSPLLSDSIVPFLNQINILYTPFTSTETILTFH